MLDRCLVADDACRFYAPDGFKSGPFGLLRQPLDVGTQTVAAYFQSTVIFIDRFVNRQAVLGVFRVQPQSHVFA